MGALYSPRGRRRRLGVVVVLIALAAGYAGAVAAQSRSADETRAVRRAAEHFLRVFENLDWERFRATWASEPTVFFPFGDTPERVTGRRAVEARWQRFFDETRAQTQGPPYLRLDPRDLRVDQYGDAALVTFTLGGAGVGSVGRRTLLFVKENGEWKLAHLHASGVRL